MKDLYAWVPWFGELCGKIAEGGKGGWRGERAMFAGRTMGAMYLC